MNLVTPEELGFSSQRLVRIKEGLIGILMTQFMPSGTYPVTPDFRILTYQALVD